MGKETKSEGRKRVLRKKEEEEEENVGEDYPKTDDRK